MQYIDAFLSGYLILIDVLLVLGLVFFILLPKVERANKLYLLLLFILAFTISYENFGRYLIYNTGLNTSINAFLGNTENPKYNLWLFNLAADSIIPCCYLLIIRIYVSGRRKKLIFLMFFSFLSFLVISQLTNFEPVYGLQPMRYSLGATFVMISCILFFMNLMKDPAYLEVNPLRLMSFWLVTVLLFYFSLTFLTNNSREYLWQKQPLLAESLALIDMVLGISCLVVIVLIIVAPNLKVKLEKEPAHD